MRNQSTARDTFLHPGDAREAGRARRHERLALLAFALSAVLLGVLGASLYLAAERTRDNAALEDRSREVLATIARLDAEIGRSQSAQRGYILYGDASFLAEREAALRLASSESRRLASLTEAGDFDPRPARTVVELVDRRAQRIRADWEEWARGRQTGADVQLPRRKERSSRAIYALTQEIRDNERLLLDAQSRQLERDFAIVETLLLACALFFLAVLVPTYVAFVREARSRSRVEARLRELAESLPGAVFQCRVTPAGAMRFEFLSRSARAVRGIDVDAALRDASTVLDSILDKDRSRFLETVMQAQNRTTPLEIDYRIRHPETGVRWIHAIGSPIRERDGSVRWSGHWADVTAQKEMEAGLVLATREAESANQAKSRFLATVSHEIRTPMNGMLAMLELLSLSRLDEDQAASLALVRESSHALLSIIDDILDFSKIEAGRIEIRAVPASVSQLVERVANIYSGVASAKGLTLSARADPRLSSVLLFDPTRLQQVLGNVVNNAIKFTAQGEISIEAQWVERGPEREVVRFVVMDTGIGMTPEEQERVFEAFVQASAETAHRFGGTGLGLAISRQLASLMGGTIDMSSQPGGGTEVRVTLPMQIPAPESLPPAGLAPLPAAALSRRPAPTSEIAERERSLILVVDDHPINRTVLMKQVNALGYAAEMAQGGGEALEKWASGRFALLLLDCNMPEISGYDVAREIRRREAGRGGARTRIVACTANALAGDCEGCLGSGMDDYLMKPIDLGRLAEKLERWLDRPAVERATLAEIADGDERFAAELLAQFHAYNEGDARELREAVGRRLLAETIAVSHRIRGASRTIGAMELAAVCERIEGGARDGDWRRVDTGMAEFERELGRLERYIDTTKVPQ